MYRVTYLPTSLQLKKLNHKTTRNFQKRDVISPTSGSEMSSIQEVSVHLHLYRGVDNLSVASTRPAHVHAALLGRRRTFYC